MPTLTVPTAPTSAQGLAQNLKAAKTVAEAVAGHPSVLEGKLDGWRLLAHVHEDGVDVFSRTAKCYTGRLAAIEQELADNFPAGTWIDGEAVAIRVEGTAIYNDWGVAQSALSSGKATHHADKITFMVFDLLAHGGLDIRALPFIERREALETIFDATNMERVQLNAQFRATEENHAALIAQGFEGSVVKHMDAAYASGQRGRGQFKLKATDERDVIVTGFKAGDGGFTGMVGAVTFGQMVDGEIVERGRCSGMNMATRENMTKNPAHWLGTVIEIRHMGVMESGTFRHPQFRRPRPDKMPESCVWD